MNTPTITREDLAAILACDHPCKGFVTARPQPGTGFFTTIKAELDRRDVNHVTVLNYADEIDLFTCIRDLPNNGVNTVLILDDEGDLLLNPANRAIVAAITTGDTVQFKAFPGVDETATFKGKVLIVSNSAPTPIKLRSINADTQ